MGTIFIHGYEDETYLGPLVVQKYIFWTTFKINVTLLFLVQETKFYWVLKSCSILVTKAAANTHSSIGRQSQYHDFFNFLFFF